MRAFLIGVVFIAACGSDPPAPKPPPSRPVASVPTAALDAAPPATHVSLSTLDDKAACALPVGQAGALVPGAKPFTREDPQCQGEDYFCDWADVAPDKKDLCFVANANIKRAENASRATRAGAAVTSQPWDRKTPPKWMDRVSSHLGLSSGENEMLAKNGFVVVPRKSYDNYAAAFHEVFQQQLPIYVGVDAILNAIFQGSQMMLEEVETKRLGPKLVAMLERMHATLPGLRTRYGKETVQDLDVYLAVPRKLLHYGYEENPKPTSSDPAAEALASELVAKIQASDPALEAVDVFGRARMIDFTQFTPRGHYAGGASYGNAKIEYKKQQIELSQYFQAMMWLSRLEWNLVSRGCRSSEPGAICNASETPREARDALALADLVAASGSLPDLRAFEDVYSVFGGRREDVPLTAIATMAAKSGIRPNDPDAQAKLATAIGESFQRTARTHYMPEGASKLPAIATMFGPRIVPDIAPLTGVVHDRMPNRFGLGFADVAYVLGHDRAATYLKSDLAAFPALRGALDKGRADLAANARGGKDVYSAWISAVTHTADPYVGATPSYAKTEAFADFRMSSALAGYGQIRHTFVLLAGQGYDAYGCEIPDGWVEPAIGVWDGLLGWARAARTAVPNRAAYFTRVEQVLGMLKAISQTELSGAPLTEPQRRWLGMVSEYIPVGGFGDSGAPPKWTGWYFDLFPDRHHGAERDVAFVADYFTLTNADQVRYLGVESVATGVFVVDVGGEPRAMVGPVVKPYEASTPIAKRLNDEAAKTFEAKSSPWTASYFAKPAAEPDLAAFGFTCGTEMRVVAQSPGELGPVSVTLLDHHGDPITETLTKPVGPDPTAFVFTLRKDIVDAHFGVEGIRVRAGDWSVQKGATTYFADTLDVATGSLAKLPRKGYGMRPPVPGGAILPIPVPMPPPGGDPPL